MSPRCVSITAIGLILATTAFALADSPKPLVDLSASDPSAATATWANAGTLGGFTKVGNPSVETVAGVKAVTLHLDTDQYRGPLATAALEGNSPRSIEVWGYVPDKIGDEAPLVAWGDRNNNTGLVAFIWGTNPSWGAVSQFAADFAWKTVPSANHWHYLVYSFDGTNLSTYVDGVLDTIQPFTLQTVAGTNIDIGGENGPDGAILKITDWNGGASGEVVSIARVRIRSGALSQDAISAAYKAGLAALAIKP